HGPFLLQQLQKQGPRPAGPDRLLALGGVRYDRPPEVVPVPADPAEAVRPAPRSLELAGTAPLGKQPFVWPALPGTAREAAHVSALAQRLPQPPQVLARSGTQAGSGQLLRDLPQARWAHLATHGFSAAPATGARQYLYDAKDFLRGRKGERVGAAARHPLTQTGLVLAGANLPDKEAGPDGGILTAEALASLNLSGLELAVLS